MNILLIGSGGREHALAVALAASPRCRRLLIAPGNPGTARVGLNVPLDPADHATVIELCRREGVDLVVIGPEAPLVAGLADRLGEAGITAFGPSAAAARLEGSKAFTKELCAAEGIPTAAFARFTEAAAARAYARDRGAPIVVKADGLAAGKGVVMAETLAEAEAAIDALLGGSLGEAGREIVLEERLVGEEASLFALCDGETAVLLGTAQDHKRAFDGDQGPNTGGMGAISPAPPLTPALEAEVMERIIRPTLAGMAARGAPFRGVLYAGLMLTAAGPALIEYNVRLGDPEAQVLLPRLRTDLVDALLAASEGRLDGLALDWSGETAVTVVMASRGYPGAFPRGSEIRGLERAEAVEGVRVYQAGTRAEGGRLLADGGRVLSVTAVAPDAREARRRAYAAVDRIDWPEGFCRRDIGAKAPHGTGE
jgi:phosphoribosylamine---glycine ligase